MKNKNYIGLGIALGAGIGTALGVALNNIAIGIAMGVGIAWQLDSDWTKNAEKITPKTSKSYSIRRN